MTIGCKVCGLMFKSLDINSTKAVNEVSEQLAQHLLANANDVKHKKLVKRYQKELMLCGSIMPWLLLMRFAADIPDDAEKIWEERQGHCEHISDVIYDEEEEGDEEGATVEGLREMLVALNNNETMLPGYEEIIEYIFGPQDPEEPKPEPKEAATPETAL